LLNRIGKNLVDLGALVASDLRLPATVLVIAIVVISLNRRRTLGIRNLAACFGAAVFLSWLGSQFMNASGKRVMIILRAPRFADFTSRLPF